MAESKRQLRQKARSQVESAVELSGKDLLQDVLRREVENSRIAWAEAQRLNALWVEEARRSAALSTALANETQRTNVAATEVARLQAALHAAENAAAATRVMLDQATATAREAWAEAKRLNSLWVEESQRATGIALMLEKEIENSRAAWAEAERLNALWVAESRRGAEATAKVWAEAKRINDLLQSERKQASALSAPGDKEDVTKAWAEAKRINDMWVEEQKRAALLAANLANEIETAKAARAEAEQARAQLEEFRRTGARLPAVVDSDVGPIIKGSWTEPDPLDADLAASAAFFSMTSRNAEWGFDGAVLLMLPGWDGEMRGNRWHVINFLAARMPVIVVQPSLAPSKTTSGPFLRKDFRFKGVWVLVTHSHTRRSKHDISEPLLHLRDIRWAMHRMGISRPLYWCFSPLLARAFSGLGDGHRLLHATEDWINFPTLLEVGRKDYEEALGFADQIVAVSHGVAASLADVKSDLPVEVVTNGCQYTEYAAAQPHRTLIRLKTARAGRLAVFAGNIDYRVDFHLIHRVIEETDDLTLCFVGPVGQLSPEDQAQWSKVLLNDRVFWLGRFDASTLPSLYHAADVGFVPYKHDKHIVESGFALKVLEMGAAGLPVVTTLMKPIVGLADAIRVCADSESFISALKVTSRSALTVAEVAQLDKVAQDNDYNLKFGRVLEHATQRFQERYRASSVPKIPGWVGADLGSWVKLWSIFPTVLYRGVSIDDRAELVRTVRKVRAALGRRHITARLALGLLAYGLSQAKPVFALRFFTAALDFDVVDGADQHQRGFMIAAESCKLALAHNRLDLAVSAGKLAWEGSRATLMWAGFRVMAGLAYAEALLRSHHPHGPSVLAELRAIPEASKSNAKLAALEAMVIPDST